MSIDAVWEQIHKDKPWGSYPKEELIRWVAKNYYKVPSRHSVKFLDLGCGAGASTWYLRREGFDCVALDGSPSAVARVPGGGIVADACAIPFGNSEFDCVVDIACITHNHNPEMIISEIFRVLKPGGKIFSMMFCSTCPPEFFSGHGYVLFSDLRDLINLFGPYFDLKINWTAFTEESYTIRQWIITGTKLGV